MKLGAKQISNKAVLAVVVVAILGLLAGAGVTYALLKDDNKSQNLTTAPKGQIETVQDAGIEDLEGKIPEGTISPTTMAAKPSDYLGKELKVRGRVVKIGDNRYVLVGQEKDKPASINLNNSKANADLAKYVGGYSSPQDVQPTEDNGMAAHKPIGAVTITGTFNIESQNLTLTIIKIES